jgi:hypothetical protein
VPERRANPPQLAEPEPGLYQVHVVDWGYHTAIVAQQPRGWRLGPPGQEDAAFIEYAWGDRSYYLYGDTRPHILFASVVLPTASVLYVGAHPSPPRLEGARAVFVRTVDAATLRALFVTLERSAQRTDDSHRAHPYPRNPWFAGHFYPSRGAYLWPRDCNWWTVARLAEVGLARRPTGVIFSGQVSGRLMGFSQAHRE